jgi:RNA polymerase sigma-70 factor, ECF subfamily
MDPMDKFLRDIAKNQNPAAFQSVFVAYTPRVRAYMIRRGVDAATAEEIAQETLLTVWRKAALYASVTGNPNAWIFTIARNLRIDRLRRERHCQELTGAVFDIASNDKPADDVVSDQEVTLAVRSALGQLPQDQREIVQLAYVDGLSHGDIAVRLSLPLGTVKSRMRAGYKKLHIALSDFKM